MIRFLSFTSGSCGNCALLLSGAPGAERGILVDAGVSLRRMRKVLQEHHLDYDCLDAVLVTHDHLDHIRHLGAYCKKLCLPVYAPAQLHAALTQHTFTRDWIGPCRRELRTGEWMPLTPAMEVRAFEVPHDATQTLGYALRIGAHRFVLMTDLGQLTDEALSLAREADTVVIESNYDVDMLLGGSYPHVLKMRICQGAGHLSNDACAEAVGRFWHPGLKNLFLCHLSENNNTPQKALAATSAQLRALGAETTTVLRLLPRYVATPLFNLEP